MSRPAPRTIAATVVAALAFPAVAGAQLPAAPDRPALAAALTSCTTGPAPADRTAVFTGSMPQIAKATSMSMRFELQSRPDPGTEYTRVKLSGFSAPVRSEPGVSGFVYAKRVEQLAPGSAYRVVVQFRWRDARGAVVRKARRTSPVCREPDLRPDLQVTRVAVGPAAADGTAPYAVGLRNAGLSVAAPSTASLLVGGALLPPLPVAGLAPGATTTLTFRAARCVPGTAVVATADAGGAVDEADEADDVLRVTCPRT